MIKIPREWKVPRRNPIYDVMEDIEVVQLKKNNTVRSPDGTKVEYILPQVETIVSPTGKFVVSVFPHKGDATFCSIAVRVLPSVSFFPTRLYIGFACRFNSVDNQTTYVQSPMRIKNRHIVLHYVDMERVANKKRDAEDSKSPD